MAKGYNPADAHRKAEKKKAAKKNKQERQSAKELSEVKRGTGGEAFLTPHTVAGLLMEEGVVPICQPCSPRERDPRAVQQRCGRPLNRH